MHTVFDLVGSFRVVKREVEGGQASITSKEIVLHADMAPNQCSGGRSVLETHTLRLAKPHIKTEGLERVWLVDWNLKERHVTDAKAA